MFRVHCRNGEQRTTPVPAGFAHRRTPACHVSRDRWGIETLPALIRGEILFQDFFGHRPPEHRIRGSERKEQHLAPGIARNDELAGYRLPGIYRGIYSALLLPNARHLQGLLYVRTGPHRTCSLLRQCSDNHGGDCLRRGGGVSGAVPHPETDTGITEVFRLISGERKRLFLMTESFL